jgi:hypothetical protein
MAFPVESDFSFLKAGPSQSRKMTESLNNGSGGNFSEVLKQTSTGDNPDQPESSSQLSDGRPSRGRSFHSQHAGSENPAATPSGKMEEERDTEDAGSLIDEETATLPLQSAPAGSTRTPDIEENLSEATSSESPQGTARPIPISDAHVESGAVEAADPGTDTDIETASVPDHSFAIPDAVRNTNGQSVSDDPQRDGKAQTGAQPAFNPAGTISLAHSTANPADAEPNQSPAIRDAVRNSNGDPISDDPQPAGMAQADVQPTANPAGTISLTHPIANPAGTISVSTNYRLGEGLPANNQVLTAETGTRPAMRGDSIVSAAVSGSEIRPRTIPPGTPEPTTNEAHPHQRGSEAKHDIGEGDFDLALAKNDLIAASGGETKTSSTVVTTGTQGHPPAAIGLVSAQNAPPPPIAAATQAVPTANSTAVPTHGIVTASPVETVQIISDAVEAPDDRRDRVVVQLDPPELGRVSIDFKFDARGIQHVTITGDNPEALRQMRLMHFELTQALERSGLSGQNMTFQEQQSGQRQAHQNSAGHTLNANSVADEASVVPVQLASRAPRPGISPSGGINIKL